MVIVFHSFHLVSCYLVYQSSVIPFCHSHCEEKPQSFYANVVVSLVEAISNRFISLVFNVCNVFFEAGVKGASTFTDVELSAFGTMNDVYSAVHWAVELLFDVHLVTFVMIYSLGGVFTI